MRLEAFIIDLLHEHDCVVLPEFGGLVANYRSARLNRKSHVISPPSKHIGFNRHLKNNDGLLASHMAVVQGISYKEATTQLEQIVSNFQSTLNGEGRLMLEKIGVFFKDKGGQLQFIPEEQENFLLSSFGLTPVQLRFVERVEEVPVETSETPVISIQDAGRKRMSAWKIAAAVVLPVMLAGAIMLRSNMAGNGNFNLASINPFQETKVISPYQPVEEKWNASMEIAGQNPLTKLLADTDKEVKYDFLNQAESENGIVIKRDKITAAPVSTDVKKESNPIRDHAEKSTRAGRYALIGGAFQLEENANNFLEKLKSEGFDAEFAGKKDGLQLVAYGYFASREEARRAMMNIKASGGHAWIKSN